jgi:hypothetical protein
MLRLLYLLALVLIVTRAAGAEEPKSDVQQAIGGATDPKALEFFENKVRPLLAERCLECHGPEKQKANLRLDSLSAILKGGDSGPALVAGKPEESLLVQAIGYTSDIKMPPKSKLPEREIADLTQWVKLGAPWPNARPDGAPVTKAAGAQITAEQRAFWAFRPVTEPNVPAVKHQEWLRSPIDHFVLARLEAAGLDPAPPASKRTLIRRATFDLTGLPPTVEEVHAFLADESSDAFARVVDRLLASPRYGERWGRHWLDVARYADSNGLDENLAYASAYRYRDYVIAAFNRDKPFNRFFMEQIAGDLLPAVAADDPYDGLIATGFLCLGAKMLAEDDPVKMQMDIIDEQVDTIGRTFLGLTLGCARCHDHKFDPIPTDDYYSLAGIFKSTKTMENFSVVARWQERPLATAKAVQDRQEHQQKIGAKQGEINRLTERANQQLLGEARAHAGDYLTAALTQQEWTAIIKAAKPVGADPQAIADRGAQVIEAENYARGNVLKDSTTYGQGIGVIYNKGELPNFAEYDVTIEKTGVYQLELRYAAAESRPVQLVINGETVKADVSGRATGSWNPDTQTWEIAGLIPLAAGMNTIRLERAQPFPHFDKLLIVPARDADGNPLAAPPSPADGYRLKPEIVANWLRVVEQSASDPQSPLAVWHTWKQTGKLPAADTSPLAGRFADLEPKTRDDIAARYGKLFAEAERAWQELKATPADKPATALPDPALESLRKLLHDPMGPLAAPKNAEKSYSAEDQTTLAALQKEVKDLQDSLPILPETMAVSENKAENLRVHLRGSHLTLGDAVPRRFPRILAGDAPPPLDDSGSGRLTLAEWLVRPDHPLTSRVMVNRTWLWHFGEGLVRSPDNFGTLGERPTHPELLDWLARRFVEQGWSLKALHRLIMLSATYQMSGTANERAAQLDPENRLWWRMNRRRLEAEALRDGLLATTGQIDLTMGGSMLPTKNHDYVTGTGSRLPPNLYDSRRRSVYLPVVRSALYEVFQAFDFADPSVMNGRRDTTTVAPQALFMMNSPLVSQATRAWAQRVLQGTGPDDAARVQAVYEQAYSRPATANEVSRAVQFLEKYQAAETARQTPVEEARLRAWQSLCRAVLAANEFVYIE